jgi:hypothetical protein
MNNETQNKFFAMNWYNYSTYAIRSGVEDSFSSALMDCKHTQEWCASAQSWKEYSEIHEVTPTGDIVNTTYFVTF